MGIRNLTTAKRITRCNRSHHTVRGRGDGWVTLLDYNKTDNETQYMCISHHIVRREMGGGTLLDYNKTDNTMQQISPHCTGQGGGVAQVT